jgi:hypothetical protein
MKKLIAITILSIIGLINGENECDPFKTSQENCYNAHPNGKNCQTYYMSETEIQCVEIIDTDGCQFDANKHRCIARNGVAEPNLKVCDLNTFNEDGNVLCEYRDAYCYDLSSSKEKCLTLDNCVYDEKREYGKCFSVYTENNDEDCEFTEHKCTSKSNKKFCYLFDDQQGNIYCKSRNIQCSDFDQDSSSCPTADLQDSTKKCSYDSSRSSGNKCFEVLIKDGCTYNNANKECQGEDLSNGKICDMDYSENPVTCQKRNIQCNDFDGDQEKCRNAKLPDKSKECSYNAENKCVEKTKEAQCNFNEDPKSCTSTLPSKIKCELKEDESGCETKNVECSDFERDQSGCNDAIISDSNKKCTYDSSKAENKCSLVSKECNDFYNEQECNSHKPGNALAKCVWSNECKEKTCETTSTENCGSFKPNDSTKKCSLNQDKNKCEEISEPEPENGKNGGENLKLFLSMLFLLIIF